MSLSLFSLTAFVLTNRIVDVVLIHVLVPKNISDILHDTRMYNRHASPTQDKDKPTMIEIQMYIEGMSSFRAQTMDFHIDVYLQEHWTDHRLKHNNSRRVLIRDQQLFDMMWHPDLYFANAKTSSFHDVTSSNFLVWIYPNGSIYYDCRISMTINCMQDLTKYPLDRQECNVRILSYAYDTDQLQVKWRGNPPIDRNRQIRMPDMQLRGIWAEIRNDTYSSGVWSCATANFIVDREIMHHIMQSYVPTALIVVISWFSFWLDVDAVPGRVSLSITTLLTLATQSSAVRLILPQVSYVKAIDVWMGTCMTFVFGALIEFTFVNYWTRCKEPLLISCPCSLMDKLNHWFQSSNCPKLQQNNNDEESDDLSIFRRHFDSFVSEFLCDEEKATKQSKTSSLNGDLRRTANEFEETTPIRMSTGDFLNYTDQKKSATIRAKMLRRWKNKKVALRIDRKSRILFPTSFAIFNLIYWTYYLYLL